MLDGSEQVQGRDVYGEDGKNIGSARQIYIDDQTGEPAWVTVLTGLLGLKESFVPLIDAEMSRDHLTVPYSKDFVKDAPNIDEDGHITPDQEQELYAYYGRTDFDNVPGAPVAGRTGRGNYEAKRTGRGTYVAGRTGRWDIGPRDFHADTEEYPSSRTEGAMTVSEERVNLGGPRRESGRARLRKYVVTDHDSEMAPVQLDQVGIEREPFTESDREAARTGPAISKDDHEVVLHETQLVVEKDTVPLKRVRLDTETVTDQQPVAEDVRKDQVDLEAHTRGSN